MSLQTEGDDAQVAAALARLPEVPPLDFISAVASDSTPAASPCIFLGGSKQTIWARGAPLAQKASPLMGRADVYFTPFACTGNSRKGERAQRCGTLFADIDIGDGKLHQTRADALAAITQAVKRLGLRPHFLMDSGTGFWLFWLLSEPLERDTWLPLARGLKAALPSLDLHIDPVVTADPARLVRMPGTVNSKNGRMARAYRLSDKPGHLPQKVAQKLAAYMPQHSQGGSARGEVEVQSEAAEGLADFAAITAPSGCAWAARAARTGGPSYDDWINLLALVRHCTDGEALAHQVSKAHPEYDPEATASKLRSLTGGPPTCERINAPECRECPHRG